MPYFINILTFSSPGKIWEVRHFVVIGLDVVEDDFRGTRRVVCFCCGKFLTLLLTIFKFIMYIFYFNS